MPTSSKVVFAALGHPGIHPECRAGIAQAMAPLVGGRGDIRQVLLAALGDPDIHAADRASISPKPWRRWRGTATTFARRSSLSSLIPASTLANGTGSPQP